VHFVFRGPHLPVIFIVFLLAFAAIKSLGFMRLSCCQIATSANSSLALHLKATVREEAFASQWVARRRGRQQCRRAFAAFGGR
jgi:hypothetical protein